MELLPSSYLVEGDQQVGHLLLGDAAARVGDGDDDVTSGRIGDGVDRDRSLRGEKERVCEHRRVRGERVHRRVASQASQKSTDCRQGVCVPLPPTHKGGSDPLTLPVNLSALPSRLDSS